MNSFLTGTVCGTLIGGTISSICGTYIVRIFDERFLSLRKRSYKKLNLDKLQEKLDEKTIYNKKINEYYDDKQLAIISILRYFCGSIYSLIFSFLSLFIGYIIAVNLDENSNILSTIMSILLVINGILWMFLFNRGTNRFLNVSWDILNYQKFNDNMGIEIKEIERLLEKFKRRNIP